MSKSRKGRSGISIHALREEGDLTLILPISFFWIFLSTPSARRATVGMLVDSNIPSDFYPRPPRGGRPDLLFEHDQQCRISIHALREEGDFTYFETHTVFLNFYPRPPRGGRQQPLCGVGARSFDFYPRPPRGGRRCRVGAGSAFRDFYPRPPRGGRPFSPCCKKKQNQISIHALREEGDGQVAHRRRGRAGISIHALREEGDLRPFDDLQDLRDISIHALREEGDLCSRS